MTLENFQLKADYATLETTVVLSDSYSRMQFKSSAQQISIVRQTFDYFLSRQNTSFHFFFLLCLKYPSIHFDSLIISLRTAGGSILPQYFFFTFSNKTLHLQNPPL